MRKMKKLVLAAAAASALLVSVPSSAKGQVAFQGTFGGPHGRFSIGVGSPAFPVGAYVPYPYVRHIYLRPSYGYGFYYGDQWIPVEAYGNRYVVVERPVVYETRPYYRHYRRWDNRHWDNRHWDDRRWDGRYWR